MAKLRYQQTKVDGVLPTILVGQAVVNVIREQQALITRRYPPRKHPLAINIDHDAMVL